MRHLLTALYVAAAALASSSALAATARPLPPGVFEPPDPCLRYHTHKARARCEAQRPKPPGVRPATPVTPRSLY